MGKDLMLGSNFDLDIQDGDFVVQEDLEQRAKLILATSQGHWKQWPLLGASLQSSLNGPFTQTELRAVRLSLEVDQIAVSGISYDGSNLNIDANSAI
jgi:hypothetical protein